MVWQSGYGCLWYVPLRSDRVGQVEAGKVGRCGLRQVPARQGLAGEFRLGLAWTG